MFFGPVHVRTTYFMEPVGGVEAAGEGEVFLSHGDVACALASLELFSALGTKVCGDAEHHFWFGGCTGRSTTAEALAFRAVYA